MADTVTPFDRSLVRRHRDRAAAGFSDHDFLFREIGERLLDRLDDIRREFPVAVDLGCRTGILANEAIGRAGIKQWISCDLSPAMVAHAPSPRVVADEEFLPFAEGSLDLVVSTLSLHWVNDLPGALTQIRRALKPDGLFLGALWGGDTLFELRQSLFEAELEETGGVSPRISPMTDLRDAGMLLQRAGFALPVVDSDLLTVTYPDALALMRDLRGMAETNAVRERSRRPSTRTLMANTVARYAAEHPAPDPGRIIAGFQALFLTGWAPSAAQQKPLRPGSATARLADVLEDEDDGPGGP